MFASAPTHSCCDNVPQKVSPPLCLHRFEAGYARIISGEDEGVYGWIAVNYLNGHLAPAAALPAPVVIQVRCPRVLPRVFRIVG